MIQTPQTGRVAQVEGNDPYKATGSTGLVASEAVKVGPHRRGIGGAKTRHCPSDSEPIRHMGIGMPSPERRIGAIHG